MDNKTFNSYAEAAAYAKQRAQQSGKSIRLERSPEGWLISESFINSYDKDMNGRNASRPTNHEDKKEVLTSKEDLQREARRKYEDGLAFLKDQRRPHKEEACEACNRPISMCRCGE